jgi:hypothetical protein
MQADHEIQKEPEAVTEIPLRPEAFHLRFLSRYIFIGAPCPPCTSHGAPITCILLTIHLHATAAARR